MLFSSASRRVVLVLTLCAAGCGPLSANGTEGRFEPMKIGFIFVGARDDLGYNEAAWEGSEAVARAFPDHGVIRQEHVPESTEAESVMERMIEDGARVLFATSYGHLASAVAVARRHPGVVVLHEGGLEPKPGPDNLGTYWGTVYEPVYEAGIAAGAASRTGRLGFVAAFPIPATYNNVNAFTLGARSVNPGVTTQVRFTGDWCNPEKQAEAADGLIAGGVDVLTQHQDCTATVLRAADRAGVRSVGYHYDGSEVAPKGWLVGSVWDWRRLFVDIVRTVLTGHFVGSAYNGDFRGGLRTGNNPFVLTELSPSAAPGTGERIAAAEARFRAGHSPFDGPLTDREGRLRVAAGVTPSEAVIEGMDWWVPGVVGGAP
jgi:basic membrane protein A and related proteins